MDGWQVSDIDLDLGTEIAPAALGFYSGYGDHVGACSCPWT